jgi:hypothetical protein
MAVVERLLRVDPSAGYNYAIRVAAAKGYLAVVDRLLHNYAIVLAAVCGHLAVVERLLEDGRVDVAVAIQCSRPEDRKRFECRERLTEICIGLQDLALPAWVTVQILDAARPWSTLPLHSKWSLVCTVKHFERQRKKSENEWMTLVHSVITLRMVDWRLCERSWGRARFTSERPRRCRRFFC